MENRFAGLTHSLLRIVAGLLFICPGGLKLFGWFGGMPAGVRLTPLLILAGVIEVFGGALITLGLFTRPVAFVASGEMAVAYFSGGGGGDFYEFVRVSPHRMLFGLMDVAGKRKDNQGICSATQQVFCSGGIELLAAEDVNESEAMIELAHRMNTAIMRTAGGVCSSSVFLGCYHEEIGTVCYVNAGHTPGLLRDDHSVVELPATGLPLGLFSLAPVDART